MKRYSLLRDTNTIQLYIFVELYQFTQTPVMLCLLTGRLSWKLLNQYVKQPSHVPI